jgi:hypothetical protein
MKFPARLPKGRIVTIAQRFGSLDNAKWYEANGIPPAHNGLDTVFGTNQETYGTPLVCPFKSCYLSKVTFDTPMSTKGNGITIGHKNLQVVFWHVSEVVQKPSYREGEIIGYVGNSGLCKPPPSPTRPFDGSHLHLMVYDNGVLKDPQLYFDTRTWYEGEDDLTKDYPPIIYYLQDWITRARKFLGI